MMSLTFGLFTQVSGSGPLGPLVYLYFSGALNCMACCVNVNGYTLRGSKSIVLIIASLVSGGHLLKERISAF